MAKLDEKTMRDVLARLRGDFASETRLGDRFKTNRLELEPDGVLILEAEVDGVAQKKIALETAARIPEISGIVDRVRVRPAAEMGDSEIRSHLRVTYGQDPALAGLNINEIRGHRIENVAAYAETVGTIDYEVVDGVVTLNGSVPSLVTKRYVGVLAWWVPGTRDVINGIVTPSDADDHAERIAEAVKLVLEKDPYVDAAQVKASVRNRTVRLTGLLPSEDQRRMAENDAWYVFGVDDVVNEIQVGG